MKAPLTIRGRWFGPAVVLVLAGIAPLSAAPLEYNRDVRPILAEACFACHGPDSASRKAGLRLDQREAALKAEAIVPGHPDKSSLVERVFSDDPGQRMPPRRTRKTLTPSQKDTLRRWIAAGADYQPHWSFIPPKRSPLPEVKNAGWVRNGVDRFILAELEKQGLGRHRKPIGEPWPGGSAWT